MHTATATGVASDRDSGGQFQPGCRPGPGRPKGSQNKAALVKQKILDCWDHIDGDERLAEWAKENFGEFLKIVVRLLPRNVEIEGGVELAAGSGPKGASEFLADVLGEKLVLRGNTAGQTDANSLVAKARSLIALGQQIEAEKALRYFLNRWENADPGMEPLKKEARVLLSELE